MTKYYGTAETNKGLGHVFERVLDLDGRTSKDLKDFLPTEDIDSEKLKMIQKLLLNFKEDYLHEKIAIVDTDITNFMVQQTAPNEYQMRIVDNIGTPVAIPLVYYFDFAATWKSKKYWNFLADWLHRHYPKIVNEEFYKKIRSN